MTHEYVVFFDLDKTLANSVSGRSLAKAAYKNRLLRSTDLVSAVYNSLLFRLKLREQAKIIDKMLSWVRGIPEATMNDLCNKVTMEEILPSVYKEAKDEIEYHRSNGARTVILSSALRAVCTSLANELNIDDVLCTDLEVNNGMLTGLPIGHICYGREKASRLAEYCKVNNFSIIDSWYYGDSVADIPALSVAGHPICINPERGLRSMALARNWKICYWKS